MRIDRVIRYIHDHFCEDLSLARLAGQACLSKYHFHRVFQNLVGETAKDYVRRTRLEKAAHRLTNDPATSIARIACDCGFSTSQNFARSFKAHFGIAPTAYRKTAKRQAIALAQSKPRKVDEMSLFSVEVRELPSRRVAYVRQDASVDQESGAQVFDRLFRWAAQRGLTDYAMLRAIAVRWNQHRTTPDESVLDLCLTVPGATEEDGDIAIQILPGGLYGVLRCEVTLDEMPAAIQWLSGKWLPRNGYAPDERPFFTIFYNNPHVNLRKLAILDMCLPVKKKQDLIQG